MTCEQCANGALARNFYPQLVYDHESEHPFRMVTEFKALVMLDGELYWSRLQAESLEGIEGEPIVKASFCPVCGQDLTEVDE